MIFLRIYILIANGKNTNASIKYAIRASTTTTIRINNNKCCGVIYKY